jgi:PAS domain S-box-containing protein
MNESNVPGDQQASRGLSGRGLGLSLRYGLAAVAALLGYGFRVLLDPLLHQTKQPFIFLFVAVVLVAAIAGPGPASLTAFLGLILGIWCVRAPGGQVQAGPPLFVLIALYCVLTGAVILLSRRMRKAQQRAEANAELARQKQRELEVDIAVRQEAQARLAEAHQKTAGILESISDGFNAFDREWRYTYVNSAAAEMVHKKPEELLGKTLWEVWPKASELPFAAEYRRAMTEKVPVQLDAFYSEPLNLWFHVRLYPSPEGLSVFFSDVTERKQEQEQRERLIQELQTALVQVKTLSGLLPICANCKKIRDDKGYWTQVEWYIRDHSNADFTHSLCPECATALFPEFRKEVGDITKRG